MVIEELQVVEKEQNNQHDLFEKEYQELKAIMGQKLKEMRVY